MERFAMERLKKWKNEKNRKPLIIRGARQVGKTWLMKEFGRTCFEQTAYVNFDNNARMRKVFEDDYDLDRLILALGVEAGVDIDASNTLIIFDEVQEVPKALSSLKYFNENAPEIAIIAAGSLLGVALHKGTSFPVGKVEFMDLYPLNFKEFLCAVGETKLEKLLDSTDTGMVTAFGTKYIEYLREYYYVGGMPEVVKDFSENKSFIRVRDIQKNLIDYYQQDFSKHADSGIIQRLNLVWNSIPMQLAKENKKYIYGQVRKGARAKDFELTIQYLSDCGLIYKVHRITKPALPLKAYMDFDSFKIYMVDIGLLIAMTNLDSKVIIDGNRIFTEFKGALTEQYVLQQLISSIDAEPYYYSTPNSDGEIDFVLQGATSVIPLEVKAEENLKARSLRAFCDKYKPKYAIRTSMSDYREQDWMTNIPLYGIDKVRKYLGK
jgi:predicted AAA+ superfamily ATPase